MMEAVRTSETSVDNHFTRQYNPEDSSEQELCGFYRSSSIARTVKFKDMMDSAYSKNVGDRK
jgi:hypothetical protein